MSARIEAAKPTADEASSKGCLDFPTEIWIRAIEELLIVPRKRDWRKRSVVSELGDISMTCRRMRRICLPYLFYFIGLYQFDFDTATRIENLFEVLSVNPSLSEHTRSVSLYCFPYHCDETYWSNCQPRDGGKHWFKEYDTTLLDMLLHIGCKVGQRLQFLHLRVTDDFLVRPDFLQYSEPLFPHIEELRITYRQFSYWKLKYLVPLICSASSLRELHFIGEADHDLDMGFLHSDTRIEGRTSPPLLPETVKYISMRREFPAHHYVRWLSMAQGLERLELELLNITLLATLAAFVDALCAHGHQLLTLKLTKGHLKAGEWISAWDSSVLRILRACTRLVSLNIDCIRLDDETIAAFPPSLLNFRSDNNVSYYREGVFELYMPQDVAQTVYEDMCAAALRLRASSVTNIVVTHRFEGERDDEIEAELQRGVRGSAIRFFRSWNKLPRDVNAFLNVD